MSINIGIQSMLEGELLRLHRWRSDVEEVHRLDQLVGRPTDDILFHNRLVSINMQIVRTRTRLEEEGERAMSYNKKKKPEAVRGLEAFNGRRYPIFDEEPRQHSFLDGPPPPVAKNQHYLADSANAQTTIEVAMHPLALQLIFTRMKTAEGRAELMAILEKTLPSDCTLSSDFELKQVRGSGNAVQFDMVAKGKVLTVPNLLNEYKVKEPYTMNEAELAAIRAKAATGGKYRLTKDDLLGSTDDYQRAIMQQRFAKPQPIIGAGYDGKPTEADLAALAGYREREMTESDRAIVRGHRFMGIKAADIIRDEATSEAIWPTGTMLRPRDFNKIDPEQIQRATDSMLRDLGKVILHSRDEMPRPTQEVTYGIHTPGTLDQETGRVYREALSVLATERSAASNGKHILYRTDLNTYQLFAATEDDPTLPGQKLEVFTDTDQLEAFFKQLIDEAFNLEIATGCKTTVLGLHEKAWYTIEY